MFKQILALFYFLVATLGYSQSLTPWSFYSPSVGKTINAQVYLPPGYDENSPTSYPYLIYLHGCCSSPSSVLSDPVSAVLNDLITSGQIQPMLVIYPNAHIQPSDIGGKPTLQEQHNFLNTEYYGLWGDMITVDLVNELENNSPFNVSHEKGRRALGGYSMGGYGAMALAAINNDLFVAMLGHSAAPTNEDQEQFTPFIISEMTSAPVSQVVGQFDYNFENHPEILTKFVTTANLGGSAAFSATGDPIGDFLFDSSAQVRADIVEKWVDFNILNLIQANSNFPSSPVAIYADWASDDPWSAISNERFVDDAAELMATGYSLDLTTNSPVSGGHEFSPERAELAMKWLNTKWQPLTSGVKSVRKKPTMAIKAFPVPVHKGNEVTLQFNLEKRAQYQVSFFTTSGKLVFSKHISGHQGKNEFKWVSDAQRGVYVYKLASGTKFGVGKLLILD